MINDTNSTTNILLAKTKFRIHFLFIIIYLIIILLILISIIFFRPTSIDAYIRLRLYHVQSLLILSFLVLHKLYF